MRFVFLIAILSALPCAVIAQEHAVDVITPETYVINSVTNLTGYTRRVIQFPLPANTVRWYYSISAFHNSADQQRKAASYSLLSKLSYLIDQTGTSAAALDLLGMPPGSDYCSVYLLASRADADSFYAKQRFSRWPDSSREGIKSGVINVTDPSRQTGMQYLGLLNDDFNDAVYVRLQVVAIVKDVPKVNGWSAKVRQETYDRLMAYNSQKFLFTLDREQIKSLTGCMMQKLVAGYSDSAITGMANYELEGVLNTCSGKCLADLGLAH